MPATRRLTLWRPHSGDAVRITIGAGRGAVGVVRGKRSRFGMTTNLVEVDVTSPKRQGQWLDVAWWRLGPARKRQGD